MRELPKNRLHIEKGMRFGHLTIVKEVEHGIEWKRRFLCKCDCGNEKIIGLQVLTNGTTKTCGCKKILRKERAEKKYLGNKYGKLTVVEYVGYDEKNLTANLKCKCDCGNETIVKAKYLVKGETKSCGCNKHHVFDSQCKHGATIRGNTERLYNIWSSMRTRCNNPNIKSYEHYGGRGIKVCDEWNDYLTFKKWALANGYRDDLSIDRKDVNGNYEPSNCRWATDLQQANNKTTTVYLTYHDETHTITEWSKLLGIKRTVISGRYNKKMPIEKILFVGNLWDFN